MVAVLALTLLAGAPLSAQAAKSDVPGRSSVASSAGDNGWTVTDLGGGRWQVAWTSPTALPVTDDRPRITAAGFEAGTTTVGADGRTVTATVGALSDARAATAPTPAALDVVLAGDRLDEPGNDLAAAAVPHSGATPSPRTTQASVQSPDPGVPGPFDVVSSDVQLPSRKLPGLKIPVEMVAHVVEPTADAKTGPRPIVLILHGRHATCYLPGSDAATIGDWPCVAPYQEIPSELGYEETQRTLASQGYYTISIRANGINAQDYDLPDSGAGARAALVRAYLDRLVGLAAEHQLDLSRVVLVGHSRGGEGVDRAAIDIPLSAPYRVVGQVLIAPTDFGGQAAAYVPTVTLLPYCDGDVYDLQGQQFTDNGRDVAPDDTSLKSSVLVIGANHNFFNEVWTPGSGYGGASDDWFGPEEGVCGTSTPTRLSAPEQRQVGTSYVSGAVHLFTGADAAGTPGQAFLPMYDGSSVTVPSVGKATIYSHALGGGRVTREPGGDATLSLASDGATTSLCRGLSPGIFGSWAKPTDCGFGLGDTLAPMWGVSTTGPMLKSFLQMSWSSAGAVGGLRFDRHPLDLRARRLELRTIVDPAFAPARLRVRLTDAAGRSVLQTPAGGAVLPVLPSGPAPVTKLWAGSVVVPAPSASRIDLSKIVSVELVTGSAAGRVWVADVSSAPSDLAAVPVRRLPTVSFGTLRIPEGDDEGLQVAQLPFTIRGDVRPPARFIAQVGVGLIPSTRPSRFVVEVAPGQRTGSIPVPYVADNVYGFTPQITTFVNAFLKQGLSTSDYIGELDVLEDDPAPTYTLKPLQDNVSEGQPTTFRFNASQPTAKTSIFCGVGLAPGGHNLQGADVPLTWLREHSQDDGPLDRPLAEFQPYLAVEVTPTSQTADIVIPTLDDGVAEAPEVLRVECFPPNGRRLSAQIRVISST